MNETEQKALIGNILAAINRHLGEYANAQNEHIEANKQELIGLISAAEERSVERNETERSALRDDIMYAVNELKNEIEGKSDGWAIQLAEGLLSERFGEERQHTASLVRESEQAVNRLIDGHIERIELRQKEHIEHVEQVGKQQHDALIADIQAREKEELDTIRAAQQQLEEELLRISEHTGNLGEQIEEEQHHNRTLRDSVDNLTETTTSTFTELVAGQQIINGTIRKIIDDGNATDETIQKLTQQRKKIEEKLGGLEERLDTSIQRIDEDAAQTREGLGKKIETVETETKSHASLLAQQLQREYLALAGSAHQKQQEYTVAQNHINKVVTQHIENHQDHLRHIAAAVEKNTGEIGYVRQAADEAKTIAQNAETAVKGFDVALRQIESEFDALIELTKEHREQIDQTVAYIKGELERWRLNADNSVHLERLEQLERAVSALTPPEHYTPIRSVQQTRPMLTADTDGQPDSTENEEPEEDHRDEPEDNEGASYTEQGEHEVPGTVYELEERNPADRAEIELYQNEDGEGK